MKIMYVVLKQGSYWCGWRGSALPLVSNCVFLVFSAPQELSIIQEAIKEVHSLPYMAFFERKQTNPAYDVFYDLVVDQCHYL